MQNQSDMNESQEWYDDERIYKIKKYDGHEWEKSGTHERTMIRVPYISFSLLIVFPYIIPPRHDLFEYTIRINLFISNNVSQKFFYSKKWMRFANMIKVLNTKNDIVKKEKIR